MINMIKAEHLKYKRTFTKKLIFITPIFIFIWLFINGIYAYQNTINTWSIGLMSFLLAIITSSSSRKEKLSGKYVTLKSKNINGKLMWFSKIIVLGYYSFIISITLMVPFFAVKLFYPAIEANMLTLFISVIAIWFTTLLLIPIYLFVSEKFRTFAAIALACIGVILDVVVSVKDFWYLCPWAINTRIMCPIFNQHPNGVLLESGDPLLNPVVIPIGIIATIIWLVGLSILTSIWFDKREVR